MLNNIAQRLDDNTTIFITKYKNSFGEKLQHVSLYFEDTDSYAEVGTFRPTINKELRNTRELIKYNSNYILCWRENKKHEDITVTKVYDIRKRIDITSDDEKDNLMLLIDCLSDIDNHKVKRLSFKKNKQ